MGVANSDRKCVSHIVRARMDRIVQERTHHECDLFFRCRTIPCHGPFYFSWRIFDDGKLPQNSSKNCDTPRMTEFEGRLDILSIKRGLDAEIIRSVFVDDHLNSHEDISETKRQRIARRGSDGIGRPEYKPRSMLLDNAVSRHECSGIDAEYDLRRHAVVKR